MDVRLDVDVSGQGLQIPLKSCPTNLTNDFNAVEI